MKALIVLCVLYVLCVLCVLCVMCALVVVSGCGPTRPPVENPDSLFVNEVEYEWPDTTPAMRLAFQSFNTIHLIYSAQGVYYPLVQE